jgi:hypothetical protein
MAHDLEAKYTYTHLQARRLNCSEQDETRTFLHTLIENEKLQREEERATEMSRKASMLFQSKKIVLRNLYEEMFFDSEVSLSERDKNIPYRRSYTPILYKKIGSPVNTTPPLAPAPITRPHTSMATMQHVTHRMGNAAPVTKVSVTKKRPSSASVTRRETFLRTSYSRIGFGTKVSEYNNKRPSTADMSKEWRHEERRIPEKKAQLPKETSNRLVKKYRSSRALT